MTVAVVGVGGIATEVPGEVSRDTSPLLLGEDYASTCYGS